MLRPIPFRLACLLALSVAMLAWPRAGAPRAADAVRVTAGGEGAGIAAGGVGVRVEGEAEKDALRIAAVANDALRRAGLRPDAIAPAQLYLKFARPRTVSGRDRPAVSVLGRGGSSSKAELGLEIQVPIEEDAAPPAPVRHRLIARLERTPGDVAWQAEAETEAVPGAGEQEALRRMAEALAKALAKAASRR